MNGSSPTATHLLKPAGIILKLFIQQYPVDVCFRFGAAGGLRSHKTGKPGIQPAAAVLQFGLGGFQPLWVFSFS
jgi:hypothetical protein